MPGFTTHYLFGVHMFQKSKIASQKKLIKNNLPAYLLGLQGPDLFFYYLPCLLGDSQSNIGSIMHTSKSKDFFEHYLFALEHLECTKEREIATAYLSGFICHYNLDISCHPFVYARTNYNIACPSPSYLCTHIDYETNLDTLLLKRFKHMLPSAFRQSRTISLNSKERRIISRLLAYSIRKTYINDDHRIKQKLVTSKHISSAIQSMKCGCYLLSDPTGIKKRLLTQIETRCKQNHFLSSLIPSNHVSNQQDYLNLSKKPWQSPWQNAPLSNKIRTDTFLDLYDNAEKKCSHTLHILNEYARGSYNLASYTILKDKLLNQLGDFSYHSGMPPSN